MIRVNFADTASRDAFAARFNLDTKIGDVQLDIDWHLLQFAKEDDKALDYEEAAVATGTGTASTREFIVQGDPTKFDAHATVVKDLGNGFYLVSSDKGLVLGDHVDTIEHTSGPVTFLGTASDITGMNGTTATLDPTSPEGQWARIRVASRYRPLLESYSTYDLSSQYVTKPEVYIVDTGVNFSIPEFDYPELETENFYTLPAFNGDFTDYKSHGTAVASMVAGKNLGIANYCKLISVKIANKQEPVSILDLGGAIDAIANRAAANPGITRIVNMSWGVARSAWLDHKIQNLLDLGITVVCAAGNSGISVEDISPAGMNDVITVASMDKYDIPSGFNNISPTDVGVVTGYGLSLDIFAPGENVMVAVPTGYEIASGTSFSAPLVVGVAAEIGAINSSMVPYAQMKKTILDTATENALLFELDPAGNDLFYPNQNKIAYIFTSDPGAKYKQNNMTMYLGVHYDGQPIVADLNSSMDIHGLADVLRESPVWSVEFVDPAVGAVYNNCLSVNPVTGTLTINEPTSPLPDDLKLKMIEFYGVCTLGKTRTTTPTLFFFHANPLYKDTQQTDITLALTQSTSISFFGVWTGTLK